jgi:hypothetical protein
VLLVEVLVGVGAEVTIVDMQEEGRWTVVGELLGYYKGAGSLLLSQRLRRRLIPGPPLTPMLRTAALAVRNARMS